MGCPAQPHSQCGERTASKAHKKITHHAKERHCGVRVSEHGALAVEVSTMSSGSVLALLSLHTGARRMSAGRVE